MCHKAESSGHLVRIELNTQCVIVLGRQASLHQVTTQIGKYSPAENRTPLPCVTYGDPHHYTTEDLIAVCEFLTNFCCTILLSLCTKKLFLDMKLFKHFNDTLSQSKNFIFYHSKKWVLKSSQLDSQNLQISEIFKLLHRAGNILAPSCIVGIFE